MLLFGWLLLSILLVVLERFSSTRSAPLWLLPPLFCLWINLHGSWLFGMVVLGMFIAAGLFEGEWGAIRAERLSRQEFKKLIGATAASFAALFINPFGYRLVAYPFDLMFRQQMNINNIEEWQSVDFHDPRGKIVMALLLLIFASALASRRPYRLYEAFLGAFAIYSSLTYWRMQYFTVLIFIPLITARVHLFPPYDEKKEKPLLNGIIIAAVLIALVVRFPTEDELKQAVRQQYPEAALAFMVKNGATERVFNAYKFGGYMIWNAPTIKTFIDGRTDIFVYNGVFADFLKIVRTEQPLELLDRYNVQYVLQQHDQPITYVLGHSPCWREMYNDPVAIIYKRDTQAAGCGRP
jgi:hypothetical protein